MAAEFSSMDVVVVGRFNPHIVNPEWLAKNGICGGEGDDVNFMVSVTPRGGAFRFAIDGAEWEVNYDRMQIDSSSHKKEISVWASGVISNLPHTPLFAV